MSRAVARVFEMPYTRGVDVEQANGWRFIAELRRRYDDDSRSVHLMYGFGHNDMYGFGHNDFKMITSGQIGANGDIKWDVTWAAQERVEQFAAQVDHLLAILFDPTIAPPPREWTVDWEMYTP